MPRSGQDGDFGHPPGHGPSRRARTGRYRCIFFTQGGAPRAARGSQYGADPSHCSHDSRPHPASGARPCPRLRFRAGRRTAHGGRRKRAPGGHTPDSESRPGLVAGAAWRARPRSLSDRQPPAEGPLLLRNRHPVARVPCNGRARNHHQSTHSDRAHHVAARARRARRAQGPCLPGWARGYRARGLPDPLGRLAAGIGARDRRRARHSQHQGVASSGERGHTRESLSRVRGLCGLGARAARRRGRARRLVRGPGRPGSDLRRRPRRSLAAPRAGARGCRSPCTRHAQTDPREASQHHATRSSA